MKKLLAILLTLIFAFSCFGTLGTTAMAEAVEQASDYEVLVKSEFDKPMYHEGGSNKTKWVDILTTNGGIVFGSTTRIDSDGDGVNDAANIAAASRLYSPVIMLEPGKKYEITFQMRIPEEYDYTYALTEDGTSVDETATNAPNVEIVHTNEAKTQNGQMISNVATGFTEWAYAYKNLRRDNFSAVWTVEGYESSAYTRNAYSNFNYQVVYPALGATVENQEVVDLNDAFADWKTVTANFTALASADNAGAQSVTVCFGKVDSTKGFQIKNFEVREILRTSTERTLFESNLNKDGNMVAFDGGKVNQDSQYVKFATEENDYIELIAQGKDAKGNKVSTNVATAPFNVYPGNEYEISYDLRIPEESATYIFSGFALAPEWWIYQVDKANMNGYQVGNSSYNDNAYAYKGKRRDTLIVEYSYTFKETGEKISLATSNRTGYSSFDFQGSNHAFTNTVDVKELFAGKWVTVTIKFTGMASSTNSGAELCAVALKHCTDATYEGPIFQVKNVKVKETYFNGIATPLYSAEEGYKLDAQEFDGVTVSDVAKFYGGSYNTEIGWITGASKIEADENGNNVLGIGSYNNDNIYLPINKGSLGKYRNLKVSFDWMFKNTGASYSINSIELVGYKNSTYTHTDGVTYPSISGVQVLSTVTPGEITLDNWSKATLKLVLNSNLEGYDTYAVRIKYKADAQTDLLYIDNLVVEDGGELLAGDYDNNGEADLEDLTKLAKYLAGWTSSKLYVDDVLADYNEDGNANLFDLVKFAQDQAGWTPAVPEVPAE